MVALERDFTVNVKRTTANSLSAGTKQLQRGKRVQTKKKSQISVLLEDLSDQGLFTVKPALMATQ